MTSPSENKVFHPNWEMLEQLRSYFLGENFPIHSYWDSEEILLQYDCTFGQRIFWKWLSVLEASKEVLLWDGKFNILDWGCGTGIASHSFLTTIGADKIDSVFLYDKSHQAVSFAQNKLSSHFTNLEISHWNTQTDLSQKSSPLILLVSHVLNELSGPQQSELLKLMRSAQVVIWVEPGTPKNSELMIQHREQLRSTFIFALPCTHQEVCGLFQKGSRNWCHFFAKPPSFIFQNTFWKLFSTRMGIDLRSLPTSFFLAVSKSAQSPSRLSPSASCSQRLLGRARHYKGYSLALICEDQGVKEEKILHRSNKEVINILKENRFLTSFLLH